MIWRSSTCGRLLPSAYCLLLIGLRVVNGQRPPGPSSPLYGARLKPEVSATGLPAALRDVGIEQKLDHQLPLDSGISRRGRAIRKAGPVFRS